MINFLKTFLSLLVLTLFSISIFLLILRGVWENPTAEGIRLRMYEPIKPHGTTDRGRFLLAKNLAEKRSFALNREEAEAAAPDAGYYKGNWFLLYAPGVSLLAAPFYSVGAQYNLAQVFTFLMSGTLTLFNLILLFLISRQVLRLPYWASLLASLTYGFGSVGLSYVTSLYQHQPTVFFMLLALFAAFRYKAHRSWGFIWGMIVWSAYGLSIYLDYPNAVLLAPIMIYFFLSSLKVKKDEDKYKINFRISYFFTAVFFIILMALHGYYNLVNYGGVNKVSGGLPGFREGIDKQLDQGNFEIDQTKQKKSPAGFLRENNMVNSSYELLFAFDKGIFVFSPIFVMGFLGILLAAVNKKINSEKGMLIALVVVNIFFYSGWGDPWGGWAFGPRYIIPAMAILALFVSYWLVEFPKFRVINRLIAFVLLIYSSAVAIMGALTTNAVPPKVEADYLGIPYGYLFNVHLINQGLSGSFIYNYFLHHHVSLFNYYLIILFYVVFFIAVVLLIMPLFSRKGVENDNI